MPVELAWCNVCGELECEDPDTCEATRKRNRIMEQIERWPLYRHYCSCGWIGKTSHSWKVHNGIMSKKKKVDRRPESPRHIYLGWR
jgi:hypothetical protein